MSVSQHHEGFAFSFSDLLRNSLLRPNRHDPDLLAAHVLQL